jgi:signal peptidase I
MRRPPLKKLLASALGLIVLGCLWFYVAPIPLGGSTSYVVTHGVSMEPLFHTGDLAIVRSKPSYRVGEIVAYRNKMLHTIVLHRIIGREGRRYIFKGDNNNFVDPEHPRASQLIGGLWIHIAGGGTRLESFASPARAGLAITLGVLLLTGGVFVRRRRRRRRDRHAGGAAAAPRAPRPLPLSAPEPRAAILALGILVLLPFVVLALLAFTRAPSTRRAIQIPYTQSGSLSYSADMAPNPAYPDGVARTGEPLFTQLVNEVNLRFDYTFATKARHSLAGKGSFLLLVTANDGWHRTLALGSPTYFHGDHATITSTLSLSWLFALTRSIETATRVDGSYEFAVVPRVVTSGNLENVPLRASFSPAIQFSIDSDEINLQDGGSGKAESKLLSSGGTSSAAAALAPELTPSASGSVAGDQSRPGTLALGPWHVSVSAARKLALCAIGIILAALLAMLALLRPILALTAPRRRDGSARILARYGGMIIPVARVTPLRGVPVIDVADMDALARIAEHYDRSILHEKTDRGETFWVADESGQFRYTLGAQDSAPAAAPASMPAAAAVEPSPLEQLAGDVYVHELEPAVTTPAPEAPTLVSRPPLAFGAPPAPAHTVAAEPAIEQRWATGDAPAAILDRSDAGPADPDRLRARAAFARMTGLEWTAHS